MHLNDINIPLKYRIRTTDKEKNSRSIFLLHGFGSHMDDLFSLNQFFPPDWTIVSLQAPISTGFGGWAWAQIDFSNIRTILNLEEGSASKDMVISSIDKCVNTLGLNPDGVHLIGFSQGATLAIYCGLSNPNTFRGVASICGLIEDQHIEDDLKKNEIKTLNTFVSNCTMDDKIPIEFGRATESKLKNLGLNVEYKEYDSGHGISNDCLNDLLNWINSIQK